MKTYLNEKWAKFNSRFLLSNYGRWFSLKSMKIVKQNPNNSGYLRLNAKTKDGRIISFTHIAVVYMFGDCNGKRISPKALLSDMGLTIDHRDGNKLNNMQSNLEIVTFQENINRKYNKPVLEDSVVKCQKRFMEEMSEIF